jgi:peptide subunit release factor RF-3
VLAGRLTPVFFGSAANNFGVQLLLDRFLELAPRRCRARWRRLEIEPASEEFSAFVFKIQANMNPKHRDRVVFVRIVSGSLRARHERDSTPAAASGCASAIRSASSPASAKRWTTPSPAMSSGWSETTTC